MVTTKEHSNHCVNSKPKTEICNIVFVFMFHRESKLEKLQGVFFLTGAPRLKVLSVFWEVKCFKLSNWYPPNIYKFQLVPPQ